MKKLLLALLSLLPAIAFAQAGSIAVTKYTDTTNNLTFPFNVPSGMKIEFRSGSTLQVDSGATFTFPSGSINWSAITGTPTTAAGYGIATGAALDALGAVATNGLLQRTGASTYGVASTTGSGNVVYSASPTLTGTIAGAAETLSGTLGVTGAVTGASFNGLNVTATTGTLAVQNLKTLTVQNTLTLVGTDASTLNIGAGGTLGSNAFNSTAYQVPETSAAGYGIANGANIDAWGALTIPTGAIVGTTATQSLTNKTLSGASNTLSNIGNGALTNSAVTIGSTSVSLGGTAATVAGLTLTSPTLTTPALGVATATTINGDTITTGTGTLTLGNATLNAGAGGTLGSNAFTSTAYAPLASPTFTGTVTAAALTTTGTTTIGSSTGVASLSSGVVGTATIGSSLSYSGGTLNTAQALTTSSTPTFSTLSLSGQSLAFSNAGTITVSTASNSELVLNSPGTYGSSIELESAGNVVLGISPSGAEFYSNLNMDGTNISNIALVDTVALTATGTTTLATSLNGVLQATSGVVSAGSISIANGGTGAATASTAFNNLSPLTAVGQLIYGGTTGAGTALAGPTSTTKQYLTSTGTGSAAQAPTWGTIAAGDLPLATTGAFGAVKPDGTTVTISGGVISAASGYTLPAATTSALGGVIVPSAGHISVDGSGNISIPQSVATSATPSFSTVTSTVSTGTAPFTVTSTTPVANLSIGGNAATATTATTATSATTANNATYVQTTATTANATYYPLFAPSSTNGFQTPNLSAASLSFNPSTGLFSTAGLSVSGTTTLNSGLSGILKATSGVVGTATSGTDYIAPGGAGSLAGLTTSGVLYATASNTAASTAAAGSAQNILFGSNSSGPNVPVWGGLSFVNDFATSYSGTTLTIQLFDNTHTFTPADGGFTIVNGTGAVTFSGTYYKTGTQYVITIEISGTGTSTIASTGGTSYINGLPASALNPQAGTWVQGNGLGGGSTLITGATIYPTTWSAYTLSNGPIYLTETLATN